MPTWTYTGDEPRVFVGDINRELQPGDTVEADENPDPYRFTGGDDTGTDEPTEPEPDAEPAADPEASEE